MKKVSLSVVILVLFLLSGCGDREQRNNLSAEEITDPYPSETIQSINTNESVTPTTTIPKKQRLQLEPTTAPTPSIIVKTPITIEPDERLAVELQGIHDANEVVSISISFGNCDVDRIFKEQYPEIYDAYWLWKNSTDYEVGNKWPTKAYEKYGERLETLVLQGSELVNTIGDKWYQERENSFWEQHSELKSRKEGGYHCIILSINYSELEGLLDDAAISQITQVDREAYLPKIVGLYQGKNVYDILVFSSRFFESTQPKPGRVFSDVFGVDGIEEEGLLRVAIVIHEDNSDTVKTDAKRIDAAFEKIKDNCWPIVEEVDFGKALPVPCGGSGRYITVLLTKQQLEDLVVPYPTMYCFVCWEGYLRGAIEGLETGNCIND